ncbi:MAG: DUF3240 family protein [Candidatus Tectimicrobiota bacterium]
MTNTCILTLIAPPEVEEKLLDHLLMYSASQLFTSHPVACHGTVVPHRNPQSQVLGRTASVRVEVRLDDAAADQLLQELHAEFKGAGLYFWLSPVTAGGEI